MQAMKVKESEKAMVANVGSVAVHETCQERAVHAEHVQQVRHHLLSGEEATRMASFFAILSDPTRLQVVNALLHAPGGELCVCDLANVLRRDDTTISHQLRSLRQLHIVSMRKAGRVVYYRLVDEHIRQLLLMSIAHVNEAPILAEEQGRGGVV